MARSSRAERALDFNNGYKNMIVISPTELAEELMIS